MKYCIIHVNDRAIHNIKTNRVILKDFEYIENIEFFNGNTQNALDVFNHMGIRTDVWNPYDGRSFPPLPGEYGIWISTINVWNYMISNDIAELLVLEDDIELSKTAQEDILLLKNELPEKWDFLSLYHFDGHNNFDSTTDIGSIYIHKSINQPSAGQAILYSNAGAKKFMRLIRHKGIEYTSDCFIFEQSKIGAVNGYSVIPNKKLFLTHNNLSVPSIIDPENIRMS